MSGPGRLLCVGLQEVDGDQQVWLVPERRADHVLKWDVGPMWYLVPGKSRD